MKPTTLTITVVLLLLAAMAAAFIAIPRGDAPTIIGGSDNKAPSSEEIWINNIGVRSQTLVGPAEMTAEEREELTDTAEVLARRFHNAGVPNECIESEDTKQAVINHLDNRHSREPMYLGDDLPEACGDRNKFYNILDLTADPKVVIFLRLGVPGITYFANLFFGS